MNTTVFYFFMALIGIQIQQCLSLSQTMSSIVQQLSSNTYSAHYSMTTSDNYNMDCLKIVFLSNNSKLGVFHSSKGQTDTYNRLYSTLQINQNQKFQILSKLSDRGSQGTIFLIQGTITAYLIAYQLQNHENGNKFAIRYYESINHLKANNFLYEYQLQQKIDNNKVRNIGTPSIESMQLVKKQEEQRFNQYSIKIKFHYSPDGSHDYPGYGNVNFNPLRDFVDKSGKWIGGCKENYSDWKGYTDNNVLNAIRKIGITGKIGQRDSFQTLNNGKVSRYYLYEANLYSDFNWKNWRIILYGENQNQALPIPFVLDKVYDLANPHVTIESNVNNVVVLQLSFFLPSEGMQPQSDASPGQAMVKTKLNL